MTDKLDVFVGRVSDLLPARRNLEYGCPRLSVSRYDGKCCIAVCYEVPGGSTCQLSVGYDNGVFEWITPEDSYCSENPQDALEWMSSAVESIPHMRREEIERQIDERLPGVHSPREIAMNVSKWLNQLPDGNALPGQSVTPEEVKDAIEYATGKKAKVSQV